MTITALACKCLNIYMEVEMLQAIDVSALQLSEQLSQDTFFNQEIQHVLRLLKVKKMLPMLVRTRHVDHCTLEQCLNCGVHTHALISPEKGAGIVLVNSKLLKSNDIEMTKRSSAYSKVFKVVVYHTTENERRYDYLPAEVEKSFRALKQQADECINSETAATEERLRIYTERQLQILNDLKERAAVEHKTLTRVILRHQMMPPTSTGASGNDVHHPPARSASDADARHGENGVASLRKVPDGFEGAMKTPSPQNKMLTIANESSPQRKHAPLQKKSSLDTECLFELDGMDDERSAEQSETSDGEDHHGGGIPIKQNRAAAHQRRQQEAQYSIAKSLPMDIPVYMTAFRSHLNDDSDEDLLQSENTTDIAASIQALARSVNGDTVFGDLPRNRCPTHI